MPGTAAKAGGRNYFWRAATKASQWSMTSNPAVGSKLRRLHDLLTDMKATLREPDRGNFAEAIRYVDSGIAALKSDPTSTAGAVGWCERARPLIAVTQATYASMGGRVETATQKNERASRLLREILAA